MEVSVRIMCIRREFPTSDNRNIVPYPKNVRIIKLKSIFTISSVLFKIEFNKKFDRLINMAPLSDFTLETLVVFLFCVVFLSVFFMYFWYLFVINTSHVPECTKRAVGELFSINTLSLQ